MPVLGPALTLVFLASQAQLAGGAQVDATLDAVARPAESPPHLLEFGLGVSYGQVRDEALSPLRWGGPGGTAQLGWRFEDELQEHRAEL
jgi:hypothetical protein